MLAGSDVIAFVSSTDLVRARAFYGEVLGLTLVDQTRFASVFDANGTMVRVTAVAELAPAPFTVLGWRVSDIATTVDALADRGVVFSRYPGTDQDDRGVWTTPGADRVAWFTDPDGNTLSVTQFAGP